MTNDNPTFIYERKQPGDPIRSRDWNTAMQAIADLGATLRNQRNGLPTGPLSVQGALTVQGSITATRFVGDGSGLTGIQATGSGNSPWANGANGVIHYTGGNVGIGTASPNSALEVGVGKSVRYELGPNQKLSLGGNGALEVDAPGVVGGRLVVTDAGNVGIGVPGPAEKLEVNGTLKATRFVGDGSGLTNLPVGSADSPWVNKTDGTGIVYKIGANVTIGATNSGTSLQILNKNQDATGDTLILGRTDGSHLRLGYHGDYSWLQASTGKSLLINPLEGNVGIGTPNPTEKLEVNGTLKATKFVGDGSGLTGLPTTGGSSQWTSAANGAIHYTGGNIGVGTAEPASRLQIDNGRVDITTSNDSNGGQNRFTGLTAWNANTSFRRGQLVLSSSYSDLVIASSKANDNHGSTLTFATADPNDVTKYRKWVINQGNWGGRKQFLDFGYADVEGRANPHDNINNNDTVLTLDGVNKRVGIGITSPTSTLHVGVGKSVRLELGNNQKLSLGGNGSVEVDAPNIVGGRFVVKESGNVGIGAPNPTEKLEVNGTLKATKFAGNGDAISITAPAESGVKTLADLITFVMTLNHHVNIHTHTYAGLPTTGPSW